MKFLRLTALFLSLAAAAFAAPVNSQISAVTVYTDRAVVTRTATVNLAGGQAELVFANLPDSLLEQSLQVSGRGTAQALILDVSARRTFVDFTPNERLKQLEEQLRGLQAEDRKLEDEVGVITAQRSAIQQFINGAVLPGGKDVDRPKLEDVRAVLAFGQQQQVELARAARDVETRRTALADKIAAVEQQMNELRGAGGRSFKTVTVRVNAAQAGNLEVALSYTVGGASWSPSYDARVLATERAVALGYFGVVRQNTGEDWKDVALTLSTARPSLGGAAPTLTAWNIDVFNPILLAQARASEERAARAKMAMAAPTAARAVNYQNFTTDAAQPAPEVEAELAGAVIEAGATSASFKIATSTTIPSDGTAQKVPIMSTRLAANPEYLTVPKRQATAFLTSKVVNSSEFPLLAGPMNVFLDGTFVATSQLRTVMAGEKFDLALGADEGIAVKHKRVQKFTEDTGLTNSGKRITYEYLLTVQNNKKTAERVIVVDQLPLSRNEKVVVKQLAPDAREVKPTDEGTLKWTLDLKPGEKREITVKFTIEHPNDVSVTGLE